MTPRLSLQRKQSNMLSGNFTLVWYSFSTAPWQMCCVLHQRPTSIAYMTMPLRTGLPMLTLKLQKLCVPAFMQSETLTHTHHDTCRLVQESNRGTQSRVIYLKLYIWPVTYQLLDQVHNHRGCVCVIDVSSYKSEMPQRVHS